MGNIWDMIEEFEDIIFNNEQDFVNTFCKKQDVMALLNVTFNSISMHFVYVLYKGQHITNSVPKEQFIQWYYKHKG